MKMKDKRVYIKGEGVGERSCPLMTINWPLNGWLKKMGRIYDRREKQRIAGMMNSTPCEISQGAKFRTGNFQAQKLSLQPTTTPVTQKNKNCEKLNLQKRKF